MCPRLSSVRTAPRHLISPSARRLHHAMLSFPALPRVPQGSHKVAAITGGNSGVGYYTVLHLHLCGWEVFLLGRSESRVRTAIAAITAEAETREPGVARQPLHYIHADLLSLALVETAARELTSSAPVLDLLILNAGIMGQQHELTADGFEVQMQTSYVSHALLLDRCLSLLHAAAHPRVVFVSLVAHNFPYRYFDPGNSFNHHPNFLFTWLRYGMLKVCGMHLMQVVHRQHPRITTASAHPGFVMHTGLYTHWEVLPVVGLLFRWFFALFGYLFGVLNEEGSHAILAAALDPALAPNSYLVTGGVPGTVSKVAASPAHATNTYAWTSSQLQQRGFSFS